MLPRERFDKTHGCLITFNDVFNLLRGYIHSYHVVPSAILRMFYEILVIYKLISQVFMRVLFTAKYEKRVKYLPIFHDATM